MQNKQTLPQLIDELKASGCKVRDEVPDNQYGDLYIDTSGKLKCARELWNNLPKEQPKQCRILNVDERIQEGDEFKLNGQWFNSTRVGMPIVGGDYPYRRPVVADHSPNRTVEKCAYRILDVGEKLQEGDEVNKVGTGEGWVSADMAIGNVINPPNCAFPHGYYRRPVSVEKPTEQTVARLISVVKEQEAEIKKLKADLFAYGEFTTNVAKALGMYIMEISFKEVLEEIGNLKKSRLMCGCSELIREIVKKENTSPEVKNWEQVAKAFENEVARQADYIEGLERDLRSESGWKNAVDAANQRIEELEKELTLANFNAHSWQIIGAEAEQKAEVFEDCLNQIAVILGPKTTIHDDGFTDGEPTCHRVVEVLTERILRLWKLEAANDNANG